MKPKVTVSKCLVRGVSMWRVRWRDAGRVHRKFFTGRDSADSHAAALRGDAVTARKRLAALQQSQQEQLLLLYDEAQRRNIPLLSLLDAPRQPSERQSPGTSTVLDEMVEIKERAGRADDYIKGLGQTVKAFMDGKGSTPIDLVTLLDVEAFLHSKNIESRSTHRSRLSTLFKFAIRRGYRKDNPCDALEPVTVPHKSPTVLTVDQVKKCLRWLRKNPRSLAWFVLSTFAGLRPEEAQKTRWKYIHFGEGWIKIEAQTTKVRQRRVVYPMPVAMEWLRYAKKRRSKLPLSTKQRTLERKPLRRAMKWKVWPKDITRHSAASYWLAHIGSAEKVATALGNSEKTLRKHYLALVTKAEAKKFWAILPGTFGKESGSRPSGRPTSETGSRNSRRSQGRPSAGYQSAEP